MNVKIQMKQMKRKKITVIILGLLLLVIGFNLTDVIMKSRLNNEKLAVLRPESKATNELLNLGAPLESSEDTTGYHNIKGNKLFQWAIHDSYYSPDIGLERMEKINKDMIEQGWQRSKDFNGTISEEYNDAKQWKNSFMLSYSKKYTSDDVCQHISFWWKPQRDTKANTFVDTYIITSCNN